MTAALRSSICRCAPLALLLTALACAQSQSQQAPPEDRFDGVRFDQVSRSRAQITLSLSSANGGARVAIQYGPDRSLGFQSGDAGVRKGPFSLRIALGGLAADQVYYFRPVLVREGRAVASWSCPAAGIFEGYVCEAVDDLPYFRTTARPDPAATLPTPPAVPDVAIPAINGRRFAVEVDDAGRCTNFAAMLQAAAKEDAALNHEIVIPAGATCYGPFTAPPKPGPGIVVVRPSTPLEQLPPENTRVDPSNAALMATLSMPPSLSKWTSPLFRAGCEEGRCSNGWRLVGIRFVAPPFQEFEPDVYGVVDATADKRGALLTLDRDVEFADYTNVGITGVQGAPDLNRVVRPIAISPRQIIVPGAPAPDGYQAGTGHVVNALTIPLEGCTGGKPIVCKTKGPHGLKGSFRTPVQRKTGVRVFVGLGHGIGAGDLVRVENSSVKDWNGVWSVQYGMERQLALHTWPRVDCEKDCGELEAIHVVQIDGTGRIDGSHLYSVVSETEFQLDYLDGKGEAIAGGYLAQDPQYFHSLVDFGRGAKNLILDRCILDGGGFPLRFQRAIGVSSEDSAVLNSHIENFNSWRGINPASKIAESGAAGSNLSTSQAIEFGDAARVLISNNLFLNCPGITLFAQPYRKSKEMTPSDVTIQRNTFRSELRYMAGSPASDGRSYSTRHVMELKRGVRFRFDGNTVDGNWADWTPTGPAIALFPVGDVEGNQVADIDITNNTFRHISSGVQVIAEDRFIGHGALPTARVRIHNNLFDGIDFYTMRSQPSGVNQDKKSANFGGYFVYLTGSMEDLRITHNTVFDNRGTGPWTFRYESGRGGGVVLTDNIFTHNADNGFGGLAPPQQVGAIEPALSRLISSSFGEYFTSVNGESDSTFSRNLILPGVTRSSDPANYNDPGASFSKGDCENYYKGFSDVVCAGKGGKETANQRFETVFPKEGDFRYRDGVLGAVGADIDALEAAQGAVSPVEMSVDPASGVTTLRYRTAAAESCLVAYSPDREFEHYVQVRDSGSGSERYASLEGLQAGREYHYRVQCPSGFLEGVLVAGGTLQPGRSRSRR
ncbi:MAG: hypothetical protein GC160_21415 [Acidobacteria bacterium]|nr:hypothetical protein [Acidobacteriota bacterium]